MAFVRGKDGKVFITDSNATSRDITTFVDNVEHSLERESLDTTTFGSTYRSTTGGFVNWTGTISGKWDNGGTATPDNWFYGLITAASTVTSTLTYFPNGSASGLPYWSGTVNFGNYAPSAPYDDVITWKVEFSLATGGVTRGTV